MAVGARVTLRGARMYEFLDRLVSIALPRIRDFRGLNPDSFDGRGQLLARHQGADHLPRDRLRQRRRRSAGLDIAITTTAETDEQARALLRALGLPFATERRDSLGMAKTSLRVKQKRTPKHSAGVHALQPVRPAARRVPQVQALPDLPARARAPGRDPGHDQELVVMGLSPRTLVDVHWSTSAGGSRQSRTGRRTRNADRSDRRHADPHPQRQQGDARHAPDADLAHEGGDRAPAQGRGLHQGLPRRRGDAVLHARGRAQVRPEPRARDHRPQARLEAGPPRLREARTACRACSAGSAPRSCPPRPA